MAMAAAPLCCCYAQALRYAPTLGAPRAGSTKNSSQLRNRVLRVAVETTRIDWVNPGQKQANSAKWRCMADSGDKEETDPTTSSSSSPQCCNVKSQYAAHSEETDNPGSSDEGTSGHTAYLTVNGGIEHIMLRKDDTQHQRQGEEEELEGASKAAKETTTRPAQEFQQIGPTKQINRFIALGSVLVAVGLFASARLEGGGVSGLSQLTVHAVPYEEALANGRPTVVEFYADWCEVCREMAKDVYRVEEEYRDRINFVMLNVDNPKWEPELDEFGVEGIPHFAFLDRKGNEEGNIVGRLPPKYLRENIMAMARGDATVPHSSVVGAFSSADSRQAPPITSPRSHS